MLVITDVIWVESQDEFEQIVEDNDVVVADFTAPSWCRPCQQFAPHFEAAGTKSDAVFVAVDVDKAPWVMEEYGVRGVPTVMHFVDGKYNKNLEGRTVIKLLAEI